MAKPGSPSPSAGLKTLGKHKYIVAVVVVVGGYFVYHWYKNRQTSSAGSSSQPASPSTNAAAPISDGTGSGSGSGPDLSGLFSALADQARTIAYYAGGTVAPTTSTPTPTTATTQPPQPGGGNVSPPTSPTQPSQPTTSAPVDTSPTKPTDAFGNIYTPTNDGGYTVGGVVIPGSIAGAPASDPAEAAKLSAFVPPRNQVADHAVQTAPPTLHSPPLVTFATATSVNAGQKAVNERPTITPRGRAA